MKSNIIIRFDLEGQHAWPDAPDCYKHLRSRHNHVFKFEAHIPVEASRQIEFLDARRELIRIVKASYGKEPCDFRSMSCEQLAESISRCIVNRYQVQPYRVAVFEDAFVGSELIAEEDDNG